MPNPFLRRSPALLLAGALLIPVCIAAAPEAPKDAAKPATVEAAKPAEKPTGPLTPVDIATIHNALKWSNNIYSGSCPEGGEAGFKALAAMGIKTVITVDGAQPDVENAKKYGLRYVHIPVEYSGIARVDAIKIIRAVRDLPGPVFIHCHHGLHRGPAAAALVAIALANYDNQKADDALKQAGTGLNYKGLWRDVDDFKAPTQAEIDAADNSFPEKVPMRNMTAAMIALDERLDGLKAAQKAKWTAPADHPDINPPHEAMLLREHYTELKRSPASAKFPTDFMTKLDTSERNAQALEDALRGKDLEKATTAFDAVKADCSGCHKVYRDTQLNYTD